MKRSRVKAQIAVGAGSLARSVAQRGPPRRPGGSRRQPAAAHDHEDVVMLQRAFRAMGTDVELLLDAEPGDARRAGARPGRSGVRAARAAAVALPRRLGALAAQPRRDRSGREPDLVRVVAPRARGPRDAPADASTRPSTTRSSRPATTARSTTSSPGRCRARSRAPAALRRRGPRRRVDDRARARHSGSISAGSARATPSTASPRCSPSSARASSTPAATSRFAAAPGPWASPTSVTLELTRGGLATSGRDRRRWTRNGEARCTI